MERAGTGARINAPKTAEEEMHPVSVAPTRISEEI